jgi:hypothetical protein
MSVTRRWVHNVLRDSPRLYTKEAMKMTSDYNRGYNSTRWIDAQSKEKTASGGGLGQGGDLRETRGPRDLVTVLN